MRASRGLTVGLVESAPDKIDAPVTIKVGKFHFAGRQLAFPQLYRNLGMRVAKEGDKTQLSLPKGIAIERATD